jgi:mRNA interferase MazF
MEKDYRVWTKLKVDVNARSPIQRFHEREIWWCNLGENVGFEEDGKNKLYERPVLIIRKFNKELFLGVPLTSRHKPDNQYYIKLKVGGVDRSAIISQVRALSSRRLIRKIDRHSKEGFLRVVNEVNNLFKKTIPVDKSTGSPVPSGNLYLNNSKQSDRNQVELPKTKLKSEKG